MLRLAVATRAETYERIRDPLADRGIELGHVRTTERTLSLTDPASDLGSGFGPDFDSDSGADPASEASASGFDVGFVFPARLMEGGAVDAALGVPWVNGREAILTSRNKAETTARLAAAGVPVPDTTLVSNPVSEDDLVEAAEAFEFPVVIKPNSTTRGVGVARAEDPDSLLGIADYLGLVHDFEATGDRSFLLQEYLPEARDYRAMVVDGEYAGAVERRLPDDVRAAGRWKHNVHRGAEAVGVDLPERHRRLAERVAAELDVAFLGVDLLETPERLVVNETNARPTVDAATKYEPGFYDRLARLIESRAESET